MIMSQSHRSLATSATWLARKSFGPKSSVFLIAVVVMGDWVSCREVVERDP